MNVKRVAVAGVIVDRRRDLEKEVVRGKREPRSSLPRQKKRVRVRDQLGPANSSNLPCRGRARPERIFRIGVVVDELREIDEEIELQLKRLLGCRRYDPFSTLFAVRFRGGYCRSAAEFKVVAMLPLLGQTFWIDVRVPNHRRVH